MAWKCLTEHFKLDTSRIYASYFGGDDGSPCDDETRELWLKYLPAERVLPFDAGDNFWEMGATGPCGPCSEIHYDRIGNRDAAALVNADVPDVIEIWNIVFIQYNREADGSLRSLPQKHIDTGMGFERLTSILQGVDSNYDTDIFLPIFDEIQKITGARPYGGKIGTDDEGYVDMAYRVVADHIRTLCFSIADGAVPSNDGRGQVLRRVLRRAVRYGRQNLGAELRFFAKLVPTVVKLMGGMFPELVAKQEYVTGIIMEEEESFSRTLDKGLQHFKELAENVGDDKVFPGPDAHFLYTSMGFPVDLTQLMCEELGMTLDKDGFEAKMQEEIELSNAAHQAKMSAGSGKDMRFLAEQTAHLVTIGTEVTDDSAKYTWNDSLDNCVVKGVFIGRGETDDKLGFVDSASSSNGVIGIVLDKTSYYAEAGGQIFDTGVMTTAEATIRINNVQQYGSFVLHVGEIIEGTISVNDAVSSKVDYVRRAPIAANHTMTHVLNYALQEVLVNIPKETTQSVDQKGSLVDENKLRYDFSWKGPLSAQQLEDVEQICAKHIANAVPVEAYVAPLATAQNISSLRAVFGEKYPDPVRVVAVASDPITSMLAKPDDDAWNEYSVEFCGGTHLTNTSEADAFVLLNEEGIAKGIRRITGVTKKDAIDAIEKANDFEAKITAADKMKEEDLEATVKDLTVELACLSISAAKKIMFRETLAGFGKKVAAYKKKKAAGQTDAVKDYVLAAAAGADGSKVVARFDFGIEGKIAKAVATAFGKKVKDKALMLVSADEASDRFLVVACAPKGFAEVDCKEWILAATEGTGAKGGGKKDNAQYTVSGVRNIDAVLEKATSF